MTNIAELLKNAPKGMKLYSPLLGEVEFAEVMDTDYVPIRVMCGTIGERFDEFGRYKGNEYPNAECLLFPSKECRTWEGWKAQVEPKFKVGDVIIWNEPKGSKPTEPVKIMQLIDKDQLYMVDMSNGVGYVAYDMQDYYKLVQKHHYAIANFHAGMPVLVRDSNKEWGYVPFSHITNGSWVFNAVGTVWEQCIPFNKDTEHLLGTTDMPSDEYINW